MKKSPNSSLAVEIAAQGPAMRKIIFLHIEKTAGTSLIRSVIEPNVTSQFLGGLRRDFYPLIRGVPAECLHGHIGYGYHRFMTEHVEYMTMLREPVDRAISLYYFIRGFPRLDLWERHPLRNYVDSVSIGQFFDNPRFSNSQTRRLAGIEFDRAYPYLSREKTFRRAMLERAKKHLSEMPVFGLQAHFEESQHRVLEYLGGGTCETGLTEAKTSERPSVGELGALRPNLLLQLQRAHALDTELFSFATTLFERSPEHGSQGTLRSGGAGASAAAE